MSDNILSPSETHLLRWLGESDYSQYGECYGKDLDRLCALGLAEVHADPAKQAKFIVKGVGVMYHAVSLTSQGWARLKELEHG